MTRARQTLTLARRSDSGNAYVEQLRSEGGTVVDREAATACGWPPGLGRCRYELLGLRRIYLDYAGCHPPEHPVHEHLARLRTGDRLTLVQRGRHSFFATERGHLVARLSESSAGTGSSTEATAAPGAVEARVVAMLQRCSDDAREPSFRARHLCQSWEIPVVELVVRG